MPNCKALTKAGEPCKRLALPGQDFCAIHAAAHSNNEESDVVTTTLSAGGGPVQFINKNRTVKVRYIGNGTYWVSGFEFSPRERIHEVPYELADYLIEQVPELFEPAE